MKVSYLPPFLHIKPTHNFHKCFSIVKCLEVMSSLVKFCGCLSILRNSVWMALLMIAWSLINPQYKYAMLLRIGLKIMEFYIIWSTYGTFKLFEGIKKVRVENYFMLLKIVISKNYHALHILNVNTAKRHRVGVLWKSSSHLLLIKSCLLFPLLLTQSKTSKFSYFLNDCIISALADFTALSIFIHQYLSHRKGLEFTIFLTCLLLINLIFYTAARSLSNRMGHESVIENNIHNIMSIDGGGGNGGFSVDESAADSFHNWIRQTDKTQAHGHYTYEMVIDEINSIYRRGN